MKTHPSIYPLSRNSRSVPALALFVTLLGAPIFVHAAPDTQAGWTGGGGGNQNWSSAANWFATSPYLAPPVNPMTQSVPGNGSGWIEFSSAVGTPNGTTANVDVPWTIGVLKSTGRSYNLYGQDLTIQQATGGSTLTLANGVIQFGNNTAARTINITNNIIFDDSAFQADPANVSHAIIMASGTAHTINFYGQVRKPSTNCTIDLRTTSPLNFYGGISNNPSILDGGVSVAMRNDTAAVTFYAANNTWSFMSMDRGVLSIQANNALPTGSTLFIGNQNNGRGITVALNDFNQTLGSLQENPTIGTSPGVRTITTGVGAGSTVTLNDNAVTNDWQTMVMTGPGRLVLNGNGMLTFRKNQTYTGGTTINNGGILQLGNGGAGGLLDGSGNITNNGTLIINSTDAFTLNGNLTGTGGLQKLASGAATLNGTVNYSGSTTVAGGTLTIGAGGNLSPSPAIVVGGGATLDLTATSGLTRGSGQSLSGSGSVLGNVTASPGSTVTVGSSAGTLTLGGNASLNTTTLNMELGADPTTVGGGVNDLLSVGGTLTLANVSTIYITPLAALNSTTPYTLMQHGGLSGVAGNLNVTLPYPGRYSFTVLDPATTLPYIKVAVAASLNGNLLWKGGNPGNPTLWDVATTTNWLNGVAADAYLVHDPVAFDDSAVTNRATLAGAIDSPSLIASNNSLAYTLDGSGSLTLTTLAMQGSGSFTIANSAKNTFGNLVANGGSLVVSNNAPNSLGVVAVTNGTLTIANNGGNTFTSLIAAGGTLAFNQPTNVAVAAPIIGAGTVAKNGANTLTLAADNAGFTGSMQINSGVLKATANNALGDGTATIGSGASLELNGPAPNALSVGLADVTVQGPGAGANGAVYSTGAYQAFGLTNITLSGNVSFGGNWETVGGTFTGAGFKVTKVGLGGANQTTNDFWIGSLSDTDIGDIEVQSGLFAFEFSGTTMGRPAGIATVRSNAALGFWACATAGDKQIVMDDGAILFAGGGAGGPSLFGGTMSLAGNVHANINASTILTYSGTIFGPGKLLKDGAGYTGVLELAGPNMHTGGTEVSMGVLRLSHSLALSNNQSVLISGTTSGGFVNANTPRLELAAGVVIPPGVTATFVPQGDLGNRTDFYSASGANEWQGTILVSSNGAFELGGAAGTTLTVSGPIIGTNFTGTVLVRSGGTSQGFLTGPINTAGEFAKTDSGTWTISSTSNQWAITTVAVGTLVLGTNDALCVTAPLVMGQGDGNSPNLNLNGYTQHISSLSLNSSGGTKRIGNDSTVSDSLLIYAGGTNISTYGGILTDAYSLGTMKLALTLESGVLMLNGANTYTGPTTVKSGAVLGGTGSLLSAVTVESGGIISPGASVGVLTINSNLTLNADSISIFEVVHSPAANDFVTGLTSVTYGGTLVITNIGVPALAAGDSFHLFQAGSYNGSFSSILPATPGVGLKWNTNNLVTTGTISVEASASPNLDGINRLPDGNVHLILSGPVGSGYTIRASTNVALAVSNWTALNSGTITVSPFTYDDLTATNFARRFYLMSIP